MINSLGYTVFTPEESLKLAKFSHFAEKMAEFRIRKNKSKISKKSFRGSYSEHGAYSGVDYDIESCCK